MLRTFFIGFTMGMADLIPGISGGTVAFLSGIYERLLTELKSLSIRSFPWKFFLPLGTGMAVALLSCAHLFAYLLQVAQVSLYAFFFGVVVCSVCLCLRQERPRKVVSWISFALGVIACYFVTDQAYEVVALDSTFGLVIAGACGAIAMLLPGVSGCFVLHLLGVYPLIVQALTSPLSQKGLLVLGPVAIGITLGVLISARLISYLLGNYRDYVFPFFIGCMVGGLYSLVPTSEASWLPWISVSVLGASSFLIIRLALKKAAV